MPTITGPILDSSGRPANGILRVNASRPFEIGGGLVTEARATITVKDGIPQNAAGAWSLPVTPAGVYLSLQQDLDGEALRTFTVTVPDVAALTYSELLFHRGGGEGGPNPYWWDLTGDQDFPPDAVNGDFGFDSITGTVWRYQK